jgi:CRISPR-associated protein Cas5t
MDILHLYISVPIAGFRVAQAREYWETYSCPPPSTVYGMLLSLVGEPNRLVHQGAELAIALVSEPQRSVVLRTLWRIKDAKAGPGLGSNKRPDFQELLSNIRLSVWVRRGSDKNGTKTLLERLEEALVRPESLVRHGGLSLGESTHLVDEVRRWQAKDPELGRVLLSDDRGDLSLPLWPDHVGSAGTRWAQFKLQETTVTAQPPEQAWVTICASV